MDPAIDDRFDPSTYGRSFADVYDVWYPADEVTGATVAHVAELAGAGGSVLELGVGTGRLALPLADRGLDVTGLDASPEMLDLLTAKDPIGRVTSVLGDVARPDGGAGPGSSGTGSSGTGSSGTGSSGAVMPPWPDGPFDVVLAAGNLLCNVVDADAQAAAVAGAATRLRPGGHLVIEAFVPAPLAAGPRLSARDVRADAVVLIATDADPESGVVIGNHVELRDGEPVRLRPWRIRVVAPAEIDSWATAAGLDLVERSERWGVDGPDSDGTVSVYRRN